VPPGCCQPPGTADYRGPTTGCAPVACVVVHHGGMPAAPRIPDEELQWRFSGSGGPGGQHANTANTRVEVTFDIAASPTLDETTRAVLLGHFGPRVRVVSAASRSQHRNRVRARQLLEERLAQALAPRARRRATTPGRAAVRRRLDAKRRRSVTKRSRRWRPGDD